MFKNPYDTTPCDSHDVSKIRLALQHAVIEGQLQPARTVKGETVTGVMEVPPYVKTVPPFAHPLPIVYSGKVLTVIDPRAFVTQKMSGETRIANPTEYQFLVLRGILAHLWIMGEEEGMTELGDLPIRVYSRLVSEALVRRLNLTPGDQLRLTVLAAYYHLCQYTAETSFDEHHIVRLAGRIGRATAISVDRVLEVLDALKDEHDAYPVLGPLDSFIRAIEVVVPSPRVSILNVALVYAAIGGVWFGAYAREIVAVSLEYPPTFLAMLYMAINDRTYHGAMFSKLVDQVQRNGAGEDFGKRLFKLVEYSPHV